MTEPAHELPLDDVGEHVSELRVAAVHGDVIYLTERGVRLAAVIPLHRPAGPEPPRTSRLAAVVGTLANFENFVDVEASRDDWDCR
jgi:antitoxin (DNA-binding transcriptional repressor) of toxin-antitoxin stability system